jgi:phosphinothricin acetyltransferase
MEYIIDRMLPADWEAVSAIYTEGIKTGNATFEKEAPTWERWNASHLDHSRLVVRSGIAILGWAGLAAVSSRPVYSGVAEISLYIGSQYRKHGVGSALMSATIASAEKAGIWTLQGSIFPENAGSLALVRKYGFRESGLREKIAKMSYGDFKGIWRDTISVERRSKIVGVG